MVRVEAFIAVKRADRCRWDLEAYCDIAYTQMSTKDFEQLKTSQKEKLPTDQPCPYILSFY